MYLRRSRRTYRPQAWRRSWRNLPCESSNVFEGSASPPQTAESVATGAGRSPLRLNGGRILSMQMHMDVGFTVGRVRWRRSRRTPRRIRGQPVCRRSSARSAKSFRTLGSSRYVMDISTPSSSPLLPKALRLVDILVINAEREFYDCEKIDC